MLDRSPSPYGDPPSELFVPHDTDLAEWYFRSRGRTAFPSFRRRPKRSRDVVACCWAASGTTSSAKYRRAGAGSRASARRQMVMAGARADMRPSCARPPRDHRSPQFNLNALQASTHIAAPLLVVNGPMRSAIGMNAGCNVFGSGNRANATIGRAIRLDAARMGRGQPSDLDKATLGHPGKYTYCIAENEEENPGPPITSSTASTRKTAPYS